MKRIRDFIIWMMCVLLFNSGLIVYAEQNGTLPSIWMQQVEDAEQLVVDVWVDSELDLAAADFVVNYDKTKMTCVSAVKSSYLNSEAYVIANPELSEGVVRFSYVNTNVPKEDRQIIRMKFTLKDTAEGETTFHITATGCTNSQLKDVQCSFVPVKVKIGKHLSLLNMNEITVQNYRGVPVEPEIKLMDGLKVLTLDDYDVSFEYNDGPGTAFVTLTGKNDYRGSVSFQFEIKEFESIEVSKEPDRVIYSEKENQILVYGGELLIHFKDGTEQILDLKKASVTGYRADGGNVQVLMIEYMGETVSFETVIESLKEEVVRIYGTSRYQTSFNIANTLKETLGVDKFESVIIAAGANYADALAGSYLAAVKSAPILMYNAFADNTADLKAYIDENMSATGTVYILGGNLAVAEVVETTLSQNYTVKRLYGTSRYDTNLEILKEAGVGNNDILVCKAYDYADSLSASAAGKPILLVGTALTDAQREFLASVQGNNIYVLGGTLAVNEAIEAELTNYGPVKRLAGASRYETSVLIAKEFFDEPDALVLAYARNFPDGLCGGPLAYALGAPMLLVDTLLPQNDDKAIAYAADYHIYSGYVLGGHSLVTDASCNEIFNKR